MDKITGKIMGGMTGFAKKVTINLVYEFIDQRTKEIKDELKEHKLENNQQFEKLELQIDRVRTELKQEMTDFKTEIKQEMTDFKTEIKQEIRSLNQRIDQLNMRLDSIMSVLMEKFK